MPLARFTKAELLDAPEGAFTASRHVRLQEVDAAGVVFFARILEFFNDAFLDYARQRGYTHYEMADRDRIVLPIKHANADYLTPLHVGDNIETSLVRCRVDKTEFAVGYRLSRSSPEGGEREPAAVGQTLHVCAARDTFKRTELPARLATVLAALETVRS